ncbi:HAD family hydrolase [Microlunatus parietis]|uniref:Putative hydrolase of the HAD superfamily n=1 Tax=Microlunatus parietis TaxID=682979 RepID=A0A7Y9IBX2_9ACTN|nr:HAD family phosphatase [Microlunatus parietis]NYE73761.1 putative hydrolase of the HAD superfamily [Microlunatus parietis]
MSRVRAVLLDVYRTLIEVDFDAALDELAARSGLGRADWVAGIQANADALTSGTISLERAFAETFRLAGQEPPDLEALLRHDRDVLAAHATLYPDVRPFLAELRRRGVGTALVSNCFANTTDLLQRFGLTDLTDQVVLSCEVGVAKPDPAIFRAALAGLDVRPEQAIFVDDRPGNCSAAEDLGITAVLIDRGDAGTEGAVNALEEVLRMIIGPAAGPIDAVMGKYAGGGPTSDELGRIARAEDSERS